MKQEQILDAMSCVDPALVEAADLPLSASRRGRWPRPAVIAACLCLVLAGTAVAAGISGTRLTGIFQTEEGPYYTYGGGVSFYPMDSFSTELLDFAAKNAAREIAYRHFYTWEEAEAFAGINIMDNPVLDQASQGPAEDGLSNVLGVTSNDGGLIDLWCYSFYEIDGVDLILDGDLYTERMLDGQPEDFQPSSDARFCVPDIALTQEDRYVAPSGLEADVMQTDVSDSVHASDGLGNILYTAFFSLNGVQFRLIAQSSSTDNEDPAHTLAVLQEVLDGFVYEPME